MAVDQREGDLGRDYIGAHRQSYAEGRRDHTRPITRVRATVGGITQQNSEWAGLGQRKSAHGLSNDDPDEPSPAKPMGQPWATHLFKRFSQR